MNALYSLYDALVSVNVPIDKARAVIDALEHDMSTQLATKSDLAAAQLLLRQEIGSVRDSLRSDLAATQLLLKQEIGGVRDSLRQDMEILRNAMTVRLGSIMVVGMGLLFAALKLT